MPDASIALVRAFYPPEGLDLAAVFASRSAENAYAEEIGPYIHRDYEMVWSEPRPDGTVAERAAGFDAHRAALRELMQGFDRFRLTPRRFVDLGDRVVALVDLDARLKDGTEAAGEGGALFTIEAGRVLRLQEFDDRAALLAAAGITPSEVERLGIPPHPIGSATFERR